MEQGNPGNLAAFPTLMDFLDDSDRYEPPARSQSTIMKHLENLSQQFLSHYTFLTEDSDGGNRWIFTPFNIGIYIASKAKITQNF
jgi:hypothetical protein